MNTCCQVWKANIEFIMTESDTLAQNIKGRHSMILLTACINVPLIQSSWVLYSVVDNVGMDGSVLHATDKALDV